MNQTLSEQLAARMSERAAAEPAEAETSTSDETPEQGAPADLEEEQEGQEGPASEDGLDEPQQGEDSASEESATTRAAKYTPKTLAEAIGWEASELYEQLEIPLGDEAGTTVPLGRIKEKLEAIALADQQAQQRLQEIQQQAEQFRAQTAQALSQAAAPSQEISQAQARIEQIKLAYQEMDWDQLRANGGDVADTKLQFSTALSQAKAQLQAAQQQHQQQAQQHYQQEVAWNLQQLSRAPEFQNVRTQEQLQSELGQLGQFAVQVLGLSPQELPGIYDHRALRALKLAAYGWQAQQAQGQAVEKLSRAPKPVMNPGGGSAKREEAKLRQLKDRARRPHATKAEKLAAARAVFASQMPRKGAKR